MTLEIHLHQDRLFLELWLVKSVESNSFLLSTGVFHGSIVVIVTDRFEPKNTLSAMCAKVDALSPSSQVGFFDDVILSSIQKNISMEEIKFTRKELYDLVWSTPMSRIAKKYEISDTGLRKLCKRHFRSALLTERYDS